MPRLELVANSGMELRYIACGHNQYYFALKKANALVLLAYFFRSKKSFLSPLNLNFWLQVARLRSRYKDQLCLVWKFLFSRKNDQGYVIFSCPDLSMYVVPDRVFNVCSIFDRELYCFVRGPKNNFVVVRFIIHYYSMTICINFHVRT